MSKQAVGLLETRGLCCLVTGIDAALKAANVQLAGPMKNVGSGLCNAVVTGDVTQIDLPNRQESGLKNAMRILKDVDDIAFTFFSPKDVVRHPLVQRIVEAYESDDSGGSDS